MTTSYARLFQKARGVIEKTYGIRVRIISLPKGFSGDLNGAEIFINQDKSPEEQLFNLLHLFGHTIQWSVRNDGYALGHKLFFRPKLELLKRLISYEREAARYAASLLVELGAEEKLDWLSIYSDCDIRFLTDFYKTVRTKSFASFQRKRASVLRKLAIPVFTPVDRGRREEGIVISSF